MSLHARITLAPLRANSKAVSFPMPVLAPVMITVFPFKVFVLLHTPSVNLRYNLRIPKETPMKSSILKRRGS